MRYGAVIDQRSCMGCHACSVACKAENGVPLGVFRTWVKYVEKGRYPHARRVFLVNRCNHCDAPPCAAICPVGAMYRRGDGVVDFDSQRCIGCKACAQACPYDAIHVDPESGTAAKCHLCAHRLDRGLEPACAAACPQRAITVGDLDEPASAVAALVGREAVAVRRPEQGTRPKVYYLGADAAALVPGAARHPGAYLWAERHPDGKPLTAAARGSLDPRGSAPRAMLAYDIDPAAAWDARVPLLLWTKAIAAGALVTPALGLALGVLAPERTLTWVLAATSLAFLGATLGVLVWDLGRRERCLAVFTRGRLGSWVTRGALLLALYGALATGCFGAAVAGLDALGRGLLWPTAAAGLGAAVYTAFLLGQCRGRELWRSPLLPWQMAVQSVLAGSAVLSLAVAALGGPPPSLAVAVVALAVGLLLHLGLTLGELATPLASASAREAHHELFAGRYGRALWLGAVGVGGVLPGALLATSGGHPGLVALAAALVLVGLLVFEWCFVMAGQSGSNC